MNNHDNNTCRPPFRLAVLVAMLAIVATACGSFDIDVSISEDGSGVRSEETIDLDFTGVNSVEVSGIWDVDVIIGEDTGEDIGEDTGVEIVLDDNFSKYTDIKVDGTVLQIKFDRGNLSPKITPTATVHLPNVERVDVDGAASAAVRGDVTMLANIALNGASELNVSDLDVGSLNIELDGASEMTVSGTADTGNIDMDGASSAQLSGLTWTTVDINLNGSSDLRVTATDRVTGQANGASDIQVAGGATVDVSSSGASTISSE